MEHVIARPKIMPLVKPVAVTLSVALLYWLLCVASSSLAASSALTAHFGHTLKIANTLRALVLVSPYAVVGTSVGAMLWNITQGTATLAAYPAIPLLLAAIGITLHRFSLLWGQTTVKDVTVLALYGALQGLLITTNALLLPSVSGVVLGVVAIKIITSTVTVIAGYPLVIAWRKYAR